MSARVLVHETDGARELPFAGKLRVQSRANEGKREPPRPHPGGAAAGGANWRAIAYGAEAPRH